MFRKALVNRNAPLSKAQPRSLRRQRGAAALFAALGVTGSLVAAAFAFDVAQLYLSKRKLQDVANLVALDVARAAVGGCTDPLLDKGQLATAQAAQSILRNGGETSWLTASSVQTGRVVVDDSRLRRFVSVTDTVQGINSVQVILQRPLPRALIPMGGLTGAGGVMTARAVATQDAAVNFTVGSYAADLDNPTIRTVNSLFNNVLGDDPGISLLSYQALADTPIELVDIVTELGATTITQLLEDPISLRGFLTSTANALFDAGESVAATAVNAVAAIAPDDEIVLGDVLGSPQNVAESAGSLGLNTYDLVRGAVMQTASPVFALTPDLQIPGVASVFTELELLVALEQGLGGAEPTDDGGYATQARNSQGRLNLALELLPILDQPVELKLDVFAASAVGHVRWVGCANRGRPEHAVELGVETELSRINILDDEPILNTSLTLSVPILGDIEVPGIRVYAHGSVAIADPQVEIFQYEGPFDPYDEAVLSRNTRTVGSDAASSVANALAQLVGAAPPPVYDPDFQRLQLRIDTSELPIIGGLADALLAQALDDLLTQVNNLLGPRIASLDPLLLTGLSNALGLSLAGADVVVRDVVFIPPHLVEVQ